MEAYSSVGVSLVGGSGRSSDVAAYVGAGVSTPPERARATWIAAVSQLSWFSCLSAIALVGLLALSGCRSRRGGADRDLLDSPLEAARSGATGCPGTLGVPIHWGVAKW